MRDGAPHPRTIATDDCWPDSGIGTFGEHVLAGLEARGHLLHRLHNEPVGPLARLTPLRPFIISTGLARSNTELFFTPGFYPPLLWRGKTAVTIHDLQYLDPEANHSTIRRFYFRFVLVPLIRRADVIITVSEESQDDLRLLLGPDANVVVVGDGVAEEYFEAGRQAKELTDAHGEDDSDPRLRLTYVGNWLAHKRQGLMVDAAAEASKVIPIQLTIPDDAPPAIERMITAHRRNPATDINVIRRPKLHVASLAEHVADSDLLLLLSSHEGFGLTPIEAQAARTPVLVSRFRGAVSRFGHGGAHYVDLGADAEEIAARIIKLGDDQRLRRSTVSDGLANAETKRWTQVVDAVEKALLEAAP